MFLKYIRIKCVLVIPKDVEMTLYLGLVNILLPSISKGKQTNLPSFIFLSYLGISFLYIII